MARSQDTTNKGRATYDAMKKGDTGKINQVRGTLDQRRMTAARTAMKKHGELSDEELEKLKPSTAPLRDPSEDPSDRAKRIGRAQALEATDG